MKQITVTIDAQGNTRVATSGFSGSECHKETAALEGLLGVKTSDTATAEAYAAPQRAQQRAGR